MNAYLETKITIQASNFLQFFVNNGSKRNSWNLISQINKKSMLINKNLKLEHINANEN
jgi:hypothetical protein